MGWWYLAIAIGFLLLAVDHLITRDRIWLVGVRVVIALGFGFLAYMELRKTKRNLR